MVQEARLALSRPAAILGLALAAGLPAMARAQPLLPNPGLTSLLQPQKLDRSRPLVPEDRSAATRSGLRPSAQAGATPCDRRGSAPAGGVPARPAGPSLYGSGSGPGDYGRYLPGAPPPTSAGQKPAAPSQSASPGAPPADRPLYGGNDRPLWNTGERRPASAATARATDPAKPASPGEAAADAPDPAPVQPNALPAPVRDRPLWAEGSLSSSADAATDPAVGGIAAAPCTPSSAAPR